MIHKSYEIDFHLNVFQLSKRYISGFPENIVNGDKFSLLFVLSLVKDVSSNKASDLVIKYSKEASEGDMTLSPYLVL